ncbi:metallophosphoesterase [Desulfotomaculum nigrificans CO-1-SRB]|uniref:Metallophosphoesterase n=1 Tax=Desulfotomaculum nigrificans (strain DSM 14880 / VKM B-2319 / CO-1-SRB) TaxID=868595 RepID=F6BA03_DESCC|nr:metallophosphoesterase [Desulfotomaculum nigrificans]AEF94972.1 metallophosphoesterase [Desulfotomaculum nigrificans CO-1-SRB]
MRHWLALIILFYTFLNFLIGRQIYGLLKVNKFVFWPVFIILAASPMLGRFGVKALGLIGNFWIVFFYYAAFVAVLGLIVKHKPVIIGCYVIIFLAILYGYGHAKDIQIAHYDLKLPRVAQELHIVMLADIHLDQDKDKGYVAKMVRQINALNPDLVFLVGDIFDDRDVNLLYQEKETFKQIKSQYGVYGVLGNHEYYTGHLDEILKIFKEANIRILRDEVTETAGLYIVGREDASRRQRKPLTDLLKGVDRAKPIILLDHQPVALNEAEQAGVNLQLSGHTHRGQFFPNQLITHRIYEDDYGYLSKGGLQVIVSSGYGTWGPPVRIGTQSEIVDIKINR